MRPETLEVIFIEASILRGAMGAYYIEQYNQAAQQLLVRAGLA